MGGCEMRSEWMGGGVGGRDLSGGVVGSLLSLFSSLSNQGIASLL